MRGQWSEHEARAVLGAWRRSGLSVERFADQRGLVPQRIYWWRKKLEGPARATRVEPSRALALLPVQVQAAPTKVRGEPVAVFLRSGHVIKLGRGFDEDAFTRAVALLEGN